MAKPFRVGLALALRGGVGDATERAKLEIETLSAALAANGVSLQYLAHIAAAEEGMPQRLTSDGLSTVKRDEDFTNSLDRFGTSLVQRAASLNATDEHDDELGLHELGAGERIPLTTFGSTRRTQSVKLVKPTQLVVGADLQQAERMNVTSSARLPADAFTHPQTPSIVPSQLGSQEGGLSGRIMLGNAASEIKSAMSVVERLPVSSPDRLVTNLSEKAMTYPRAETGLMSPALTTSRLELGNGRSRRIVQSGTQSYQGSALVSGSNGAVPPNILFTVSEQEPTAQAAWTADDTAKTFSNVLSDDVEQRFVNQSTAPRTQTVIGADNVQTDSAPVRDGKDGTAAGYGKAVTPFDLGQTGNYGAFSWQSTQEWSGPHLESENAVSRPHDHQSVSGDVLLDGALVGRWLSRQLSKEAERSTTGPIGYDIRRGRFLPGASVGI